MQITTEVIMDNQFDFGKIVENLTAQIAQQAQQIAVLQAIIQQMVEQPTAEDATEDQETEPVDAAS